MTEIRTLLGTEDLSVSIGGQTVTRDLTFDVRAGDVWGVIGANGVGKTTLLHTLAGLRAADGGHIELGGKHLSSLTRRQIAQRVGLVTQHTQDHFGATVYDTTVMGRHPYLNPLVGETREDLEIVEEVLKALELDALRHRRVDRLSGGERRRVSIATALTQDPGVYLLDEPTNHLDMNHQFELMETVVQRARSRSAGVVVILHDVNQVSRFCSHVLMLFGNGKLQTGESERLLTLLTRENLGELYGRPIIDTEVAGRRVFVPS